MKNLLVITHCAPTGLPQQGFIVGASLKTSGVQVRALGKAKSGWGRFLEITTKSFLFTPIYHVVLVDVFGLRAFVYESAAILLARLWKKRLVIFLHNGCMPDFVERWPRWSHFILAQADLVLVPHRFLFDRMTELGLRIDRIIPNFIKLNAYRFRQRAILTPKFLYLRGTHPLYNAPMALRAFALVQSRYPDAHLTMAGKEGDDGGYCRALVKELRLNHVEFIGIVPKEDISVLADLHDIYLQTSRVDNMPVSIIEMWACGLPIVATQVGGMPYLIRNRQDGILIPPDDHHTMAKTCMELLSDPLLASTLSRNGRARAAELDWEHVKPLWEKALQLHAENTPASPAGFNPVLRSHNR